MDGKMKTYFTTHKKVNIRRFKSTKATHKHTELKKKKKN